MCGIVRLTGGGVAFYCKCDPDAAMARLAEAMEFDHEADREHDAAADAAITRDLEIDLTLEMESD